MAADRRAERQSALRRRLEERGLDAFLVAHLPNIRYLTGFTGSAGALLLLPGRTVLVSDFRYASQAPGETAGAAEVEIERTDVWDRIRRLIGSQGPARLGFEREHLTVRDAERLAGLAPVQIMPVSDAVEALREVKDPEEVAAIIAAAELAQEALAEVLVTIRVGESELDVAGRLEHALRRRGTEWHPFPTIVASGPRSALPHARTSARIIVRGDWVLLDFGAQVDGYCADLTRTVLVGAAADSRQRAVYEVVRSAQHRARQGLRAGMTGREADALARDPITAAGFGDAFGHALGHGLGLEVHEGPRLGRTMEQPLPAGAVVTVEPGIYLEGWGGIRLEDDVHLTAHGPRCLTNGRTELVELR